MLHNKIPDIDDESVRMHVHPAIDMNCEGGLSSLEVKTTLTIHAHCWMDMNCNRLIVGVWHFHCEVFANHKNLQFLRLFFMNKKKTKVCHQNKQNDIFLVTTLEWQG